MLSLATVWLGWALWPERPSVGYLAGAGVAVYPPYLALADVPVSLADASLFPPDATPSLTEASATIWLAVVVTLAWVAALTARWRGRWYWAAATGLLMGVAAGIEPILLLMLPLCGFVFWLEEGYCWSDRLCRESLGRTAIVVLAALLVALPWLGFRHSVIGAKPQEPLAGQAPGLGEEQAAPSAKQFSEETPFSALSGRGFSEAMLRLKGFLLADEEPSAKGRLARLAALGCLALAAIGLLVSRARWGRFWPMYLFAGGLLALVGAGWAPATLRPVIEPMLFVWAACAIAPLFWPAVTRTPIRVYRPGELARDPFDEAHGLPSPHFEARAKRRAG
jgi:hypothetical protein